MPGRRSGWHGVRRQRRVQRVGLAVRRLSAATGANGNISANPLYTDDYGLLAGSPAIDAGHPHPSQPSSDLFGNPRLVNSDEDGAAVIDMGAIEFQGVVPADYHPLTPARILDTRYGNGAPVARLGPGATWPSRSPAGEGCRPTRSPPWS